AGRGEGGTGKLLGIEAIGAALWRVPAEGQSAFQSFALELVAEAGHVAFVIRARAFCAQEAVGKFAAGGGGAVHRSLRCFLRLQDAAPDLVRLDRLEERPEVAFAETLVSLALDELEEDRPDNGPGKDLQQDPGFSLIVLAVIVDHDAVLLYPIPRLSVPLHPFVAHLVVGARWSRYEREAIGVKGVHRRVDVV